MAALNDCPGDKCNHTLLQDWQTLGLLIVLTLYEGRLNAEKQCARKGPSQSDPIHIFHGRIAEFPFENPSISRKLTSFENRYPTDPHPE